MKTRVELPEVSAVEISSVASRARFGTGESPERRRQRHELGTLQSCTVLHGGDFSDELDVKASHLRECKGMVEHDSIRAAGLKAFELEAETVVVHQLDLVAQLEAQLRAVHHTMRAIEKLRSARHRIGRDLSNAERGSTLTTLSDEIRAIDAELHIQHQSCLDVQRSIRHMHALLKALREGAARVEPEGAGTGGSEGSPQA